MSATRRRREPVGEGRAAGAAARVGYGELVCAACGSTRTSRPGKYRRTRAAVSADGARTLLACVSHAALRARSAATDKDFGNREPFRRTQDSHTETGGSRQ